MKPILAILRELNVGEVTYLPIERINTITQSCYNLKIAKNREYKTHREPKNGRVQVTRVQ